MGVATEQNFNYFLNNQFTEFAEGEWVAIYNKQVISHGKSLEKVIKLAKKTAPMSKVLISKIKKTASYL